MMTPDSSTPDVAAPPIVVLAAGAGRRMRSPAAGGKLAEQIAGHAVIWWTLHLVQRANDGVSPVFVVVSPQSPLASVVGNVSAAGEQLVTAWHAKRGMAWTLRAGIEAARESFADTAEWLQSGVIVLPGDDPITACALPDLIAAIAADPTRAAVIDRGRGATPHPVYLPAATADRFVPPKQGPGADRGFRGMLTDAVQVPTSAPAPVDLDEPRDRERLAAALEALER